MEEAQAAVKDFTSRAGKHQTTVHEHHRPAVTHEHVTPRRHEQATTVVNREVHQEHYHTSVQPIHHRETLPEKHHHNLVAVAKKEHHHGDKEALQQRLAAETAHFKDVTETGEEEHTHEVRPIVTGEHIHHHVHHTIQPIIQKETIQPMVVHTTIPIHEVHHNEAKHHAAAALPAISLADWKKAGGSMTGRAVSTSHFDGEPDLTKFSHHGKHGTGHGTGAVAGAAAAGTAAGAAATHHRDRDIDDRNRLEKEHRHHHGNGATTAAAAGAGVAAAEARHKHHDKQHEQAAGKMDPRVDHHRTEGERVALAAGTPNREPTSSKERVLEPERGRPLETTQQFADTHAGSKMDTVGSKSDAIGSKTTVTSDRNPVGVASTTGTKLTKNTPHQSNMEAAQHNTRKDGAHPPGRATSGGKRRSLLDRLSSKKETTPEGKRDITK